MVLEQPQLTPVHENDQRALARGGALSFVGAAASSALGLVVIIVLGRTLGDAGAGVVLQTIAVFSIALAICRFGMDSTALWILPRLADHEYDHDLVRRTAWYLVGTSGLIGILCALAITLGATALESRTGSSDFLQAVRSTAVFLPIAAMLITSLTATRALGRVTAYVWIGNIALPALRPITILGAVGIGAGLTGAAVAWALPLAPALFLALFVLTVITRRYEAGGALKFWEQRIAQKTLGYALPRVASETLGQLLIWVAVIAVGAIAGASAAGVYGAASRFIAAGLIVDTALRVVVAPMLSRHHGRGDTVALIALHRVATHWLVLFSTPVFIALAIYAETWLSLVGPAFTEGATVLSLMCVGALVTFFAGNIHSVLLMSGKSGLAALNKLCVVLLSILLIILLTPTLGILGAAIAWCIASITDAMLATLEVRYLLRINISLTAGSYAFMVGALTVGIPATGVRLLLGQGWASVALAATVSLISFSLWCWCDRNRLHLNDFALRLPWRSAGAAKE